jgi:hypothetical protein
MPHTDDDTVLGLAIRDILVANKNALELDGVLYGFHTMIPFANAAVVMSRGKNRALAGVQGPGGRTLNGLIIGIDLHRSLVGDEETERIRIDEIATAVENLIHDDTTVGGIIIHGFFDRVDRGNTSFNNGSMFRTVAMSFIGTTKTLIQ